MASMVDSDFRRMGARVKVEMVPNSALIDRSPSGHPPVQVNVLRDAEGPFFQIERRWAVTVSVANVDAEGQHLLLVADHAKYGPERFSRFLCGHDERDWFVAAIPESAQVRSVQEARDALKPPEVSAAMREYGVPMEDRDLRRTHAFVRQGEWFFIPEPLLEVYGTEILRDEPIRRGSGKPHVCEMVFRQGGRTVWVCSGYPNGLNEHSIAHSISRSGGGTGIGARWSATRKCTPAATSATPITRPSTCTSGTACS